MTFVVVETQKQFLVIPGLWLEVDEKKCKYPPYGKEKRQNAIKDIEVPAESWNTYNVLKVHGKFGNYIYYIDTLFHFFSLFYLHLLSIYF